MERRFLSRDELSNLYNISRNTVNKRIKEMKATGDYKGAFKQPGRILYVDVDAFDNYLIRRASG